MKIALLTLGKRGDIPPVAFLGKNLQSEGITVTIPAAATVAHAFDLIENEKF
jgi:UDP:flavonoid glycosyltransferase YjiC (YdhE family)